MPPNATERHNTRKPKVAIIGAGPGGILAAGGIGDAADITIFEKASLFGGQWNFMEDGLTEPDRQHSSMYTCLWINAPKEALELPNHRFPEGLQSFLKRPQIYNYLKEYIEKYVSAEMKFNCKVEDTQVDQHDRFKVTWTENGQNQYPQSKTFDYVIVATGHFSVPNDPELPGQDTFTGSLIHARDYRDGRLHKGKRVLCIGGSYSAEDIALQCWKFGAKYTHITHRTPARMGLKWPEGVTEKDSYIQEISGSKVIYQDGSEEEYDLIVKCTGYLHDYPFLPEDLRLKTANKWIPDMLYNQCVFIKNPNMFYIGMQNQAFTFPMFQLQGYYIKNIITGKITLPDEIAMWKSSFQEQEEEKTLTDPFKMVRFQGRYCDHLSELTGETKIGHASEILVEWINHKLENILEYRDKTYRNHYTGEQSVLGEKLWIHDFE